MIKIIKKKEGALKFDILNEKIELEDLLFRPDLKNS